MASPAPTNWRKLPGKARRYENVRTGETISRRQFENLRFQKSGWKSWSDYQHTAKSREYRRFAQAAGARKGLKPQRGALDPTSEFNQLFLAARDAGFPKTVGGPFDKFLKAIGLRKPDAQYDVGDTP